VTLDITVCVHDCDRLPTVNSQNTYINHSLLQFPIFLKGQYYVQYVSTAFHIFSNILAEVAPL
jgi:hypothetical protein